MSKEKRKQLTQEHIEQCLDAAIDKPKCPKCGGAGYYTSTTFPHQQIVRHKCPDCQEPKAEHDCKSCRHYPNGQPCTSCIHCPDIPSYGKDNFEPQQEQPCPKCDGTGQVYGPQEDADERGRIITHEPCDCQKPDTKTAFEGACPETLHRVGYPHLMSGADARIHITECYAHIERLEEKLAMSKRAAQHWSEANKLARLTIEQLEAEPKAEQGDKPKVHITLDYTDDSMVRRCVDGLQLRIEQLEAENKRLREWCEKMLPSYKSRNYSEAIELEAALKGE